MARSPAQPLDAWSGVTVEVVHADLYPCAPSWRIRPHVIDRHGFFFVWKGHGWVERDGERFAIAPGDLTFSRRGARYASGHDPQRPLTVISVGMRLQGPAGSDPLLARALPDRLSLTADEARRYIATANEVVAAHAQRGAIASLAAQGAALGLLALALRLAEEAPAERRHGVIPPRHGDATRLARVLAHVDAHLHERLSLPTLARLARLSPAYFAAFFRERTGTTAMEHLRRRRIAEARALLRESDAPIEEIARRVGYPDPFHFSRVFRRLVGKSPSGYRSSPADPLAP
jgi:AraC-like DNA-binding protein/mannose-6-phosphate isomerase-like protein (cupin superfamily)